MEFIEFLKKQFGDRSYGQIANATGIGTSHLSQIMRGIKGTPKPETLKKLSKTTNATYEELMQAAGYTKKGIKVRVLGSIPAGVPIEAIEDIWGEEEITPELASKGEFFGLRVTGNSMAPVITEGDIVIVKKQDDCQTDDVAVVFVNGFDATLKQVKKSAAGITLVGFNPAFTPIFYSNEQIESLPVRVVGVVYEMHREFKKF